MPIEEKIVYVYDDFSEDKPVLLGRLYVGVIKGGETYSFEYDIFSLPIYCPLLQFFMYLSLNISVI